MLTFWIHRPSRLALGLIVLGLAAHPAWAELYKCQQANGQISYQQTACADSAGGGALAVDTRAPTDGETGSKNQDYSIESQVQAMQAQREQALKERERARKQAETEARRSRTSARTEHDPAKCAKQRAEVAKWHQKVLNGYRTRSEKELNENKLAYHQALMDRDCE